MIRSAERSGNAKSFPNSYVHKIDDRRARRRATGAVYFGRKEQVHLQRANAVISPPTWRKP